MPQPMFNYSIKKSSFKYIKHRESIHSWHEVDHINNYINEYKVKGPFDVLIHVESLRGLTTEFIDAIDEKFQYFQITDKFHDVRNHELMNDEDIKYIGNGNGEILETKEDGVNSYTIYSRQELRSIIQKYEEMEKGLDSLDDFTKIVTLYDRLKRHISYDYKTKNTASFHTRSLRGMLSGKSVCAGYATILQQALLRQGINCKYVQGKSHAWNVIILGDKRYPVDLTWDSSSYHKGIAGMNSMKYFAQDVEAFKKSHVDENGWYNDSLDAFDPKEIQKALGFSNLNIKYLENIDSFQLQRDDGSKFYLAEVSSSEIPDKTCPTGKRTVYKYIYVPIVNNQLDMKEAKIVASCTSYSEILREIDNSTFYSPNAQKVNNCEAMKKIFINNLMSAENISTCIDTENSNFLGVVFWDNQQKIFRKANNKEFMKNDAFKPTSHIVVGDQIIEGQIGRDINQFNCHTIKNQSMQRHRIYSETDLFKLPINELKKIFNPLTMERMTFEDGGYLGKISQDGSVVQDPATLSFARNRVGIRIK